MNFPNLFQKKPVDLQKQIEETEKEINRLIALKMDHCGMHKKMSAKHPERISDEQAHLEHQIQEKNLLLKKLVKEQFENSREIIKRVFIFFSLFTFHLILIS